MTDRIPPRAIEATGYVGDGAQFLADDGTWKIPAGGGGGGGTSSGGGSVADTLAAHRFPLAAHRGDIGSADSYPENTKEAFRQAARKGVEIIETDVHQSADGTWWIMHDTTVDRTTSGSGTVSAMTDAALAALNIDGGLGYSSSRHGTSLKVPTLAQALDVLEPYGALLTPELISGDASALAQFILDQGCAGRVIIEVHTTAQAAAVKAVDPSLTVLVNKNVSTTDPNTDWLSWDIDTLTSLSSTQPVAPLAVKAYVSSTSYGESETARFQAAWSYGARAFQTNNVDAALILREQLTYLSNHLAATDPHTQYQRESEKGTANGYASLGADGLVPSTQLPAGLGDTHREVAMADFGSGLEPVSDASGDWQYGTYAGV